MKKVAFISHATVLNGAPITLVELVMELGKGVWPGEALLGFPVSGPLLSRYDLTGLELVFYGRSAFGREIPIGRPWIRSRLRRIFSSRGIALVVANSLESFQAVEAAGDLGIPVIWLVHELASGYQQRREWEEIRRAASTAGRLIFNSRIGLEQGRLLGEGIEDRGGVVYPGIRFPASSGEESVCGRRLRAGGAGPILGSIGDLCPQKGHRELIEAFAIVARVHPRARLVIVGRIPGQFARFKRELDGRLQGLALADRVRFAGERPDLDRVLGALDILVHPSRSESFGRAVAEALAREIPVVAARSGGVEEIVADGETGLLVPPRDPDALAAALFRLLADPPAAKKMAIRGRREVGERFGLDRSARQIAGEIEALLK